MEVSIKEELKTLENTKIQQYPNELEWFINFMIKNSVKTYLEIGVKSGHLLMLLNKVCVFDKIYGCDINISESLKSSLKSVEFYCGDSLSEGYRQWRSALGHIDMVFIDAEHTKKVVKAQYCFEKELPHRFIAFHDIFHKRYPNLSKFWKSDVIEGNRIEFVNKDPKNRLIALMNKTDLQMKKYRRKHGTSAGIGICWKDGRHEIL